MEPLPEWTVDEYGTLNLRFVGPHGPVHAWIVPLPAYCDRGRWQFCVSYGVPSLDGMDSFPRYYTHLGMATKEASDWINWRLYQQAQEIPRNLRVRSTFGNMDGDPMLQETELTFHPAGEWESS